jgi:hypothetical protein
LWRIVLSTFIYIYTQRWEFQVNEDGAIEANPDNHKQKGQNTSTHVDALP